MPIKTDPKKTTVSPKKPVNKSHKKILTYSSSTNGNGTQEIDSRYLFEILMEVKNGNFNVRMPIDQTGLSGKICDTLNDIISLNEPMQAIHFCALHRRS